MLAGFGAVLLLAACWPVKEVSPPRYGQVMVEMGHRFELTGKAGGVGRFELALFELGEMEELLDEDLPRAALPRVGGTADFASLTAQFRKTSVPDLRKATEAHDVAAFRAAFGLAAQACNQCHQASGHGFVEVSGEPTASVPRTDPPAPR